METEQTENDIKETISWNTALSTAYLNVSFMEASLAISQKKRQIRNFHKDYLAGDVTLNTKLEDISNEEKWKLITEQKKEKHNRESQARIKLMTEDAKKIKREIQAEIDDVLRKINIVDETIKNAQILQENDTTEMARVNDNDIYETQEKIKLAKQELEQLNADQATRQSTYIRRMQKPQFDQSDSPGSIKGILNRTSPKAPTRIRQ